MPRLCRGRRATPHSAAAAAGRAAFRAACRPSRAASARGPPRRPSIQRAARLEYCSGRAWGPGQGGPSCVEGSPRTRRTSPRAAGAPLRGPRRVPRRPPAPLVPLPRALARETDQMARLNAAIPCQA